MYSESAIAVLEKRYLAKDEEGNVIETPDELFARVARHVASADALYGKSQYEVRETEEKFYNMMREGLFLPNSPTLMNAGREMGQLSACFVLPVDDSMESIFDAVKYAALIHKSGGGTGFDFSKLRPKGDIVRSTSGIASGPVSFMKVFDSSVETVKQGGRRRGANMGVLRVDHPDIEEFITAKRDGQCLNNFNISVAFTDEFMRALENDGSYDLINPRNGVRVRSVKAKKIFDLVVESAWLNGEPGVIFIDRINQFNPTPHLGRIDSVNPCVTGDTWVMTADGPRQVFELVDKQFRAVVDGREYLSSPAGFFRTGRKPVFRVLTDKGYELRATAEHPVLVVRYGLKKWVKVGELKRGDTVVLHNHRLCNIWDDGESIVDCSSAASLFLGDMLFIGSFHKFSYDEILSALEKASSGCYREFLRTMIDRLGVIHDGKLVIPSVEQKLAKAIQRMLLRLGIVSSVLEVNENVSRIEIEGDNLVYCIFSIGSVETDKSRSIMELVANIEGKCSKEDFVVQVTDVVEDGVEDVYDVQIPGINAFDANGFYVHNCGEQPLLPFESCNLGSINLSKVCIKNGRTRVDYDLLREVVWNGVHFLDNVIDVNCYPLEAVRKKTTATRKIGLGVMGWADMLIQLGIPYDSEEAEELASDIMEFINVESKKASAQLAKERGNFPAYKGSIWDSSDTPYMRNATTTTIAPTGSISIIAGCSSGIEPLFAVAFTRNILGGTKLFEVNRYFEQMAKEYGCYSKELIEKIASGKSLKDIPEIPQELKRLFVTAHDISPEWHVRIQAAFQKHVDNAVSKTINLCKDATVDDVRNAYLLAYRLGCKGVTVYRDGSRGGQVIMKGKGTASGEESKPALVSGGSIGVVPRERPEVTYGVTAKINTGCGRLYVTINEDEHGICEVFAQMGKAGGCAHSQIEAISRLVSLALRSGVSVESIIEQLMGIRCPSPAWNNGGVVHSCADAIARSLAKYLKNGLGHRLFPGDLMGACPECGGIIEHEGGCLICRSCGFSRCG